MRALILIIALLAGLAPLPAAEQTVTFRLVGLSAPEREADLREVIGKIPEFTLASLDAAKAEVTLRFDPEKLFPPAKGKQPAPAADKVLARLDQLLGTASTRTFSLTERSAVPAEKLTKLEIPIGVLDCKGCRYAAYIAVAKLDGVERATVSTTPSAVIAWVDATKVKREDLVAALKKMRVELPEAP